MPSENSTAVSNDDDDDDDDVIIIIIKVRDVLIRKIKRVSFPKHQPRRCRGERMYITELSLTR